ncbi:uncharacterized protein LOC117102821 [Anneissia japonica]|uniref:uncharacterized protein LOC117102821 n=1 Tax=Anneissia japonica TaxID=1529436 RepID=UPI0014257929|nr:uncharacterized protein LOC117102821 [Anneissia japonica]XP_033099132.1 uncharacterized protein LOC117102821 [Anneissia japonica]XP_033099133.1 uncharacterized protein LOC117102821 [Anneissia japonica]XP_033099134.1 uncharacterized protein LOC117102821 [Anneissia japonica]XP_033099135.1 uncharacterized protein LOC117102821 [Anneissia japonica]XP_033099136.1 uncharacterized protein LOC117102821 [Anneissia japonica]XP_033099138.1 uncharacterized protein LOC117102821 [Anneissia japonica]
MASSEGPIAGTAICRRQPTPISIMMFCYLTICIIISVIFKVNSSPVLPKQSETVVSWSLWGNCSRSCGGGLAERVSICHGNKGTLTEGSHKCKENVQYKLCNYQSCPVGKGGDRWHQLCARYDNAYYHWRPYKPKVEHINPCALRCYAVQNIKLVVQLPDMHDGKLCSNPAHDIIRGVCHKGECVKVGCDNVLNSEKKIDVCGICGGKSKACEAIEGEFQTDNLKVGYNEVVQIPAGAKNIQIIEKRGKNYLALRNDAGEYFLNGNWLIERPGQIPVAGTLVNYRRPQLWVMGRLQGEWETITAPGPTNTSICVMVLCADTSTHIEYRFTLPTVGQDETLHFDVIGSDKSGEINQEYFQAAEQPPHMSSPTTTANPAISSYTTTVQSGVKTTLNTARPHGEDVLTTTPQKKFRVLKDVYTIHKTTVSGRLTSEEGNEASVSYGSYDSNISRFRHHAVVYEEPSEYTTDHERSPGLVIDIKENLPVTPKQHSSAEIIQTVEEIIGESQPRSQNAPSGQEQEDKLKDTVDPKWGGSFHSQFITGRPIGMTEYIDTETTDVSSESDQTWAPLSLIEQESAFELSELIIADVVYPEETIVEDFNAPTKVYDYNSTEVTNVNLNGERNNWGSVQDTYYANNGGFDSTYTWTTSGSTECSATCTRGVSSRYPYCQGPDGKRVSDDYCDISLKPNPTYNECSSQYCEPRWEVGKWSGCSTTCGEGRLVRLVNCWRMIRQGLDSSVDNRQCAHIPKPNSSESCQIIPCDQTWTVSEWRSCNVSCGDGYETRDVECVGPAHLLCDQTTKPSTSKPCNAGICTYRWHTSEWTPCPGICGVQTRNLECQLYNGTSVAPEMCRKIDRPYETRLCGAKTCPPRWIAQPWSPCSVKCGQGTHTRSILCASVEFNKMRVYPEDSGHCRGLKPLSTSNCITSDCVGRSVGQWFTSEWSQCSVTCGNGNKEREVKCYYEGVEVNGCKDISRPSSRMVCRNTPCVAALTVQSNTGTVCKDLPHQSCGLIKAHQLCRLQVYNRKCCATCASR